MIRTYPILYEITNFEKKKNGASSRDMTADGRRRRVAATAAARRSRSQFYVYRYCTYACLWFMEGVYVGAQTMLCVCQQCRREQRARNVKIEPHEANTRCLENFRSLESFFFLVSQAPLFLSFFLRSHSFFLFFCEILRRKARRAGLERAFIFVHTACTGTRTSGYDIFEACGSFIVGT